MGLLSKIIGSKAERRAARHLRRGGYRIVERNVLAGPGEIDLIAVKDRVVVFVEVRFRAEGVAAALSSVDADKARVLVAAVRAYRTRERLWDVDTRIDLVALSGRSIVHVIDVLAD